MSPAEATARLSAMRERHRALKSDLGRMNRIIEQRQNDAVELQKRLDEVRDDMGSLWLTSLGWECEGNGVWSSPNDELYSFDVALEVARDVGNQAAAE